ncbi:MAG: universal stress protein [Deltaproteobacteria bacterium]|nr:universal stress protein [Deltaproteobacteria bacterium]
MEKKSKKRILVAFDGSFHANESVRYIAAIPAFRQMEIVLFNVFQKIPDCYYDLEVATPLGSRIKEIHAWEAQEAHNMEQSLDRARRHFIEAGVPGDRVRIVLREREKGIARDIAAESKQGYAAVVVGRKGVSRVRDLVMGSVSAKLLERLTYIPLIVVGRASSSDRVLIAVDPSEGAMRAVSFAARSLGTSDCRFTLANVIRGDGEGCAEELRERVNESFDEARSRLARVGVDPDRISTRMISGARSRAAVLVQKADQGGFGTIVVGRRGLSKVKDFFMGRVSNKVMQLVRDQAVWVVS